MQRRIKSKLILAFLGLSVQLFAVDVSYEDFDLTYVENKNNESDTLDVAQLYLKFQGEYILRYVNGKSGGYVAVEPNAPYRITVYEKEGVFDQILINRLKGKHFFLRIVSKEGKLHFTTEAERVACDG